MAPVFEDLPACALGDENCALPLSPGLALNPAKGDRIRMADEYRLQIALAYHAPGLPAAQAVALVRQSGQHE
ncbi:hypothetical protein [Massilia pseudoviolaceinigra]|uniref:hypothetical protein n=1 Tax=Massilia pseudoviolaceinigra TaxID=3057165 RepID=UPI0027966C5F|nr:hypothetical protein [Massilia sp. CCM 9206]MDQ1922072.1 hypothetical protein [Massilia sp. CCM 9206]